MTEGAVASQPGLTAGPDQTLTIAEVVGKTEVTNKKDASKPHHRYRLKFAESAEQVVQAFIFAWMNMEPQAGQKLTGELKQHPEYGWQFEPRVERKGGGGFKKSPEEQAAIQRQHSQHMALLYAQAKAALGQLPEDFKPESLRPIIDWFDDDIKTGAKRALASNNNA